MKIMYLIDQMFDFGGIQKILSQKINYWLEEEGYEVILITHQQQEKAVIYKLRREVLHLDLSVNYDLSKSYFHPQNLIKITKHYLALKNIISILKPDVVVSCSFTPDQYFLPFLASRIPKIKEFHSSGFVLTNNIGGLKKILFNIFKRYDKVAVLNKDEANYYPNFSTVIIPNFIDVKLGTGKPVKKNKMIAAGRIVAVKQFNHIIQAWSLLSESRQDWELSIYGDGDPLIIDQLKTIIIKNNLEKSVFLKGVVSNVTPKMEESKIYLMTSITECFPMVLLEAQQSGLAIVSYDSPHGPKNIVTNNEDGILVELGDIKQFANAIEDLICNDEKLSFFSANAKKNVEKFDSFKVMLLWRNTLENLLSR